MSTSPDAGHQSAGWAALIVSFALIAFTVVLFGMAFDERVENDAAERSAEAAQLLEARRTLELSTLEVVSVRMLDGAGVAGDRSDRLAAAAADVLAATADIVALSEGDGVVALEADELIDDVDIDALDDPANGSLEELFYVAEDAARYTGRSSVVTTQRAAIHQLGLLESLPLHIMVEGIAADVSVRGATVDPEVASFFETAIEVVRTEGGWFGADATAPFDNSEWIEVAEASELLPAEIAQLEALAVASPLIEFDAWMRNLGDSNTRAPIELTEALVQADELQSSITPIVDELVRAERADSESALAGQQSSRRTLFILAIAAGVLALATFAIGVIIIARAVRSSRARAVLAFSDALTGVGNRHELDHRTAVLVADPSFGHHVVAMIDLDRFKMTNDVFGHAAGDAILSEIAWRLKRLADDFTAAPGVESSVIRLGGDEFLLTLHGAQPFDVGTITAKFDAVRNGTLAYGGERLELGFSLGVVQAEGPSKLSDLMSTADLAVYDEKLARAGVRRSATNTLPPPTSGDDRRADIPAR